MIEQHSTAAEIQDILVPIEESVAKKAIESSYSLLSRVDSAVIIQAAKQAAGIHIGEGKIITAKHAYDFGKNHSTIIVGYNGLEGHVVYSSPRVDLGVIEVASIQGAPSIEFAQALPSVGETVFAVSVSYVSPRIVRGLFQADVRNIDPNNIVNMRSYFVFNDNIDPDHIYSALRNGNSGSGVFNMQGQLIGILTAHSTQGESRAIALQAGIIQRELNNLR